MSRLFPLNKRRKRRISRALAAPTFPETSRDRHFGQKTSIESSNTDITENFIGSYTAEIAHDKYRRLARTVPSLTEANPVIDQALGLASLFTFATGVQVGVIVGIILLPSILNSRADDGEQSLDFSNYPLSSNRSSAYGGSRTAVLALWARSQAHLQGSGGPDFLAPRLLERTSLLGPNMKKSSSQLLSLCALLSRANFRLTRRVFEDQAAYVATLFNTGLISQVQVRTCWLDDCVETFVRKVNKNDNAKTSESDGGGNVVILGSGFDTRCYRLNLLNMQTFEVDAPGTQGEKIRVLKESNIDTCGTIYCPCDFETQDWLSCLVDAGFDVSRPTMFVWEGVTMYLPKQRVVDTMKKIATKCKAGSWYLAFDYVSSEWAMSPVWQRAMERVGEPFKFAMTNDEPEELVQSCGLELLEHLKDEKELATRYLPKHYDGRPMGILGRYGGFVVAAAVPSNK